MLGQIHRRPDDGDLGGAVGEAGGGIGEIEFPWLHRDFGVGNFEVADQAEQEVRPGPDEIAQPDPAVVRRDRDEIVDGGVDPAQRVVHLRQPGRTQLGQRYFTGVAGEQHDAELMLELFDGRRQRGLGDEQPLGGATVVEFLAEGGEVTQLPQRDVPGRRRILASSRERSSGLLPYGSRGSPNSRSAMMLSCTSVVPP